MDERDTAAMAAHVVAEIWLVIGGVVGLSTVWMRDDPRHGEHHHRASQAASEAGIQYRSSSPWRPRPWATSRRCSRTTFVG